MERSTLHIKTPHEVHIAAKVAAAKRGTSMNQYVVDLISADVGGEQLKTTKTAVEMYREAPVLDAAEEGIKKLRTQQPAIGPKYTGNKDGGQSRIYDAVKTCKNGHPILEGKSRCMTPKCKYSVYA